MKNILNYNLFESNNLDYIENTIQDISMDLIDSDNNFLIKSINSVIFITQIKYKSFYIDNLIYETIDRYIRFMKSQKYIFENVRIELPYSNSLYLRYGVIESNRDGDLFLIIDDINKLNDLISKLDTYPGNESIRTTQIKINFYKEKILNKIKKASD